MREHLQDIGKVWGANVLAMVTLAECKEAVGLIAACLAVLYTACKIHETVTGRTVLESYRRKVRRGR